MIDIGAIKFNCLFKLNFFIKSNSTISLIQINIKIRINTKSLRMSMRGIELITKEPLCCGEKVLSHLIRGFL